MTRTEDLTLDDILLRKKEGRHALASLSFGEKVLIVERLRQGLAPFSVMRQLRRANADAVAGQTSTSRHD